MPKINKLSFTLFLLFTFFFINSCGKSSDNSNKEYLSVVSTNPRNSQTNISTDTKVVMILNKSFGDIKQNTITDNTLTILDSDFDIVTGHINMVGNNLIFKPSQALKANEKYTVTLGKNIKDLDGNTLKQDYTYSFTTKQNEVQQDETQPTPENNNQTNTLEVSSTIPSDKSENIQINTNIIFTFNESINENSVGNDNLSILDTSGNIVNGNIRVVGNRVIFNPSSDLSYDTQYSISLTTSIKGESGANLNSIYSFSFTTKKETQDNKNPNPPTNITSSDITQRSIKISWDEAIDEDGNIQSYYMSYKKENGSYGNEITTTSTNNIFNNLEVDTNYTFRIRAKDDKGDYSDYAYSSSATTSQATEEQGSIEGIIKDKLTNENIKGATISTGSHTAISNDNGSYIIANLSYGIHRLRISLNGYEVNEQNITISQSNNIKDILLLKNTILTTSLLKKTGQTTSYTDYDDGHYKIGIENNYIRSNDIVTDTVTNLMWQDDSDAKSNRKSQSSAMSYCNSLNLGGHSDWQLPTVKELLSIVDISKYDSSISDVFQNITSSLYWSSSSVASNSSFAWYVHFSIGYTSNNDKTFSLYVRCVRGRQ